MVNLLDPQCATLFCDPPRFEQNGSSTTENDMPTPDEFPESLTNAVDHADSQTIRVTASSIDLFRRIARRRLLHSRL